MPVWESKMDSSTILESRMAKVTSSLHSRRPNTSASCSVFKFGRMLHMHFRTTGCSYGKCYACDYGVSASCVSSKEIRDAFASYYQPVRDEIEVLLLGTLGSILDQIEFPAFQFETVLDEVALSKARIVIFETGWTTLSTNRMHHIVKRLSGKIVYFECGLESSNEIVRTRAFGKKISNKVIQDSVKLVHNAGARVIANIMVGAPLLSRGERMADALQTSYEAFEWGIDEIVLFPVNIKPYTTLRRMYDAGCYEPVDLRELLWVLKNLPSELLGDVSLAWWGNRTDGYSLPSIKPRSTVVMGEIKLEDVFSEYMTARLSSHRADIILRAYSNVDMTSFAQPAAAGRLSSDDDFNMRMTSVVEKMEERPFGDALVWIGPRESDIDGIRNLFVGSSTVYGSDRDGNISYCGQAGFRTNHDNVTHDQISTMARHQREMAEGRSDIRFLAYNPYYAYGGDSTVFKREVCLNSKELLDYFCDKRSFRKFASQYVRVPDSTLIEAKLCTSAYVHELFPHWSSFVVQRGISSGGYETYHIDSSDEVPTSLHNLDEKLLVSKYYGNTVPVNIHAVIFDNEALLFPGSVQLIEKSCGKLVYCGCDYPTYSLLPVNVREAFEEGARSLCDAIRIMGYRGILGLDAVVQSEEVYFLEMNARFQASTHALNRGLLESGYPAMQTFHMLAFAGKEPEVSQESVGQLKVPYSSVAYSSTGSAQQDAPIEQIRELVKASSTAELFEDGMPMSKREKGAYLFSVLYHDRVSSLLPYGGVRIEQNIFPDVTESYSSDSITNDAIRLKIALLNQGARISDRAAEYISNNGGLREGVYDSADFIVGDYVINIPIFRRFANLSPFEIDLCNESLVLKWLNNHIAKVQCYFRTGIEGVATSSGFPISRLCFLAADRIRLQHHDRCDFKCNGGGCRFCDFPAMPANFNIKDVCDAFDAYDSSGISFRHILIGGGTNASKHAVKDVLRLVNHIRSKGCDKPIYYMDIPPRVIDDLERLRQAGVTEVGFNIEIYNREIARRLMPAKGRIPLSQYFSTLERSVELWGRTGAVRSALVVGLEEEASTLKGVEEIAKRGASPILSVYRPTTYSEMANAAAPSNRYLYDVFLKATSICDYYGVSLGPSCKQCRNNVLAL